MLKPSRYLLFLVWFSYMIIASILLFTRGFLLSRVAHTENSTCTAHSITSCSLKLSGSANIANLANDATHYCTEDDRQALMNELHRASHVCLPQRARVVLIIIDAFRYDFATFDPEIKTPLAFQNKMPIIDDMLKVRPTSSRLYQFIADPPTTTMQRLKALTTGSLPTFIDAGSNFASAEINEDNLIDQLIKQEKNIVFMGDDTWISLYPARFMRSYAFPSFDVFDLDTVDRGVTENLFNELKKKDWDLLIGHYLGVDHCGHRYGPTHSEMSRKLTEMNNIIQNTIRNLDDNTILFVIGDHGMTSSGDHGGESADEVTAAMFVHSKTPLTESKIHNTTIKQVDLVPTLATILGIPIPYANLGSLVVNSLPVLNKTHLPFPEWHTLLFAIWSNTQQMTEYIKDYAFTSQTFSQERLQNLYEKFALLNARVRTISLEKDFNNFMEDALDYTQMLRKMCEEVWVQFDSFSMSRGLVLCFISIFLVYMIISGIPSNHLPEIFTSSFLPCSYVALFIAAMIGCGCFYLNLVENLVSTIFFATGMVSVFMLAILVIQNWEVIAIHWYNLSKNRTNIDLVLRLTFLFSWCGLLSNSYIVEEGNVSLFLLLTSLFLIVYEHKHQKNHSGPHTSSKNQKITPNSTKNKLLLITIFVCVLARLSMNFWRCREEQRWCISYFSAHSQGIKSETGKAEYLITLITIAVFVTATRNWLRSCGNLVGFSPTIFLIRYAPTVMVVATGGFWVLHRLPKDTKNKILAGWHPDSLAWIVYGFVIAGIVTVIIQPLCVYIIPNKKEVPSASNQGNIIPQLFNHVKELFNDKCQENNDVPIVCGLATVYSATYITISTYISLLLVLLLGEMMAPSVILLYFSTVMVCIITAISRFERASTTAQLFEVSNSSIFAWMLLSLYFFYASGHQPTFPNIVWEAAFIGTGGIFSNNFIPATLVIINTFGSYILMGVTLPLLFIAPFTLYIIFPSLCPKKTDPQSSQKDVSRGEIVLYENDSLMFNNAFVMSCKYILCHAIRVFVCMLAATIHCRHLMVWKIFAPKLIFEAIGMMVTLGSVVLGYLLLIRINFKVNRLIVSFNKQTR